MAKMEKYDSLVVFMAPTSQASCEKSRHWGHPNFSVIPKPKEKPPTAYSVCLQVLLINGYWALWLFPRDVC